MNSSTDILSMSGNQKRKSNMDKFKNNILKRLLTIFNPSSNEPITLKYQDRLYITECLKEIQPMSNEHDFESNIDMSDNDVLLSRIRKNMELSFETEEYKEREKRLLKKWAKEDQMKAEKVNNELEL